MTSIQDATVRERVSEVKRRLETRLPQIDPHHRLHTRPVHYGVTDGQTLEITYRDVPSIGESEVLGVKKLIGRECFCTISPQTAETVTVRFVVTLRP